MPTPGIYVLAGVNGAGKSSIGGAAIRATGADYFNPDEVAARLRARHRDWSQREANAAAWSQGVRLLTRAIEQRMTFAFETTLGGQTMCGLLARAAEQGMRVHVWFVGLATPELHVQRVRARVAMGGHDIPEADIRRRFDDSRLHLIQLLPAIHELRVFDNSRDGDPARGMAPRPQLILHWKFGRILAPKNLTRTPAWARAIVAAARRLERPKQLRPKR